MLPGGGATKHENRMRAAIRELREETSLKSKHAKYLFSHDEPDDILIKPFVDVEVWIVGNLEGCLPSLCVSEK
ncbi:MAG: NUDIX domain-containing protein [Thaumarchaeota archaeon]|nr:NUDIX domain-containing protein [Nitrososphaerota archaeon]